MTRSRSSLAADIERRIQLARSRAGARQLFDECMASGPGAADEAVLRLALGLALELRPPECITSFEDFTRDAKEQYLLALALPGPHRSTAHWYLGHIEGRREPSRAAEAHLRAALATACTSEQAMYARESLIRVLIATGRPLEAARAIARQRRLLRRVMARGPADTSALALLLRSLVRYGPPGAGAKLVRGLVRQVFRLPDGQQRLALRALAAAVAAPGARVIRTRVPVAVDVSDLDVLFPAGALVTPEAIRTHGLLSSPLATLHITAAEPLKVPLIVRAHSFTKAARGAIRRAGGRSLHAR